MADNEQYLKFYKNLDGVVAMLVAENTELRKRKGERDTEFIKRIVANYLLYSVNKNDSFVELLERNS